jgi:hypothetical protein
MQAWLSRAPTALRPLHVLTIEVDMKRRAVVQARALLKMNNLFDIHN